MCYRPLLDDPTHHLCVTHLKFTSDSRFSSDSTVKESLKVDREFLYYYQSSVDIL